VSLHANEICHTYKGAWPLLIATSIIISLSRPLIFREYGKVGSAAHNALHSHYIEVLRSMLAVGCMAGTWVRPCEIGDFGTELSEGHGYILLNFQHLPVTDGCEDSRRKLRASPGNFHDANQFPKIIGWEGAGYLLANLRFSDRPKIFRMEEYML
jgi:hypothetical protein